MAHLQVDRRSLTPVILISFLLVLSVISFASENVKGDDDQWAYRISIDGDDNAYKTWHDWSNYYIPNQGIVQDTINLNAPDGKKLLLFSWHMHHGGGEGSDRYWIYLSEGRDTFTIRNVMKYAVGVTMFNDSSVNIVNCKEVVIGMGFEHPGWGWLDGYLRNSQVTVSNFEKLWIYNFSYSKSDGEPMEIIGNGNSTVVIRLLNVHPSVMVNHEGLGIRKVGKLEFNTTIPNPHATPNQTWTTNISTQHIKIMNHTPDMVLENVKNIELNKNVILDNRYYSVSDNKWEKSGIGIVTKNVTKISGGAIYIRNCDTGIAFENNGKGEALNNSDHVVFENCTQKYSYGYAYSPYPFEFGDLITGFQILTGFLVAVAWIRIAIFSTSEKKEKKELSKDMFWKAVIGSLIVAIVVYGYPIMVSIVNYVFGG